MASFVDRVVGAATLNVSIYEDIEADKGATVQAIAIVVLSSLAVGVAQAVGWFFIGGVFSAIVGLVGYTVLAVAGWLVWTIVTLIVGTKILPEPETKSDMGELVRTVGFAQTPGMFRIFSIIPFLGLLVTVVVWIWMLAAFVIAARQALDYKSTGRAIAVCAIGWVINGILVELLGRGIVFALAAAVGASTGATGG